MKRSTYQNLHQQRKPFIVRKCIEINDTAQKHHEAIIDLRIRVDEQFIIRYVVR